MTTVPAQGDLPPLPPPDILQIRPDFHVKTYSPEQMQAYARLAIELSRRQEASSDSKIQSLIDHRAATIDDELSRERAFSRRLMAQRDALADELDALAAGRQDASEPVAPDDERDDARDAARYRWLRATDEVESVMVGATIYGEEFRSGADLDAAIDAVIASMPESPKAGAA